MTKVIECEARDIQVDDELVNMGVVSDVHGGDDFVLIEYRGAFSRFVGAHAIIGHTYRDTDTMYRFKREGENPNRYAQEG